MKWNVLGGVILAFVLVWLLADHDPPSPSNDLVSDVRSSSRNESGLTEFSIGEVTLSHPAEIDGENTDHRFTRFQDGVSYWHQTIKLSHELHREDHESYRDLEIINEILTAYRLVFKENPVGTDNEEFAAALAGENSKKVVFIDPAILSEGELLDRHGFPYFFHPLSAEVMGLRSRGADGQLWTHDDLILDVGEAQAGLGLFNED